MQKSQLMMNQIIEKLNEAAELNQELTLSKEEVIELSNELGDSVYIPVLTLEEMAKICKTKKLNQINTENE